MRRGKRGVADTILTPLSRGRLTVLNNFGEAGIGSFGRSLVTHLRRAGADVELIETAVAVPNFLKQLMLLVGTRNDLVANVGLTSWGRSLARNLLGFITLALRSAIGLHTILLLHNLIEVVEVDRVGYTLGPVGKMVAHAAISLNRKAVIGVFSRDLADALRNFYSIEVSRCAPLPCEPPSGTVEDLRPPYRLVAFGFLSPYKGLDLTLKAQGLLAGAAELQIVGKSHALLSQDPSYQTFLASVEELARVAKVRFLGFVPDESLVETLRGFYAGILAYTTTTGTSASFTNLATACVPVVATDLPAFKYLAEEGGGIVLVPADPAAIARAVDTLIGDPSLRARLAKMQEAYAATHSWPELCDWITQRFAMLLERKNESKPHPS